MVLNIRFFAILSIIAAAIVLFTSVALAKGNTSNTRPGWGFGDENHIHTGPPGHSVRPDDEHDNQGNENDNDQGENAHQQHQNGDHGNGSNDSGNDD